MISKVVLLDHVCSVVPLDGWTVENKTNLSKPLRSPKIKEGNLMGGASRRPAYVTD